MYFEAAIPTPFSVSSPSLSWFLHLEVMVHHKYVPTRVFLHPNPKPYSFLNLAFVSLIHEYRFWATINWLWPLKLFKIINIHRHRLPNCFNFYKSSYKISMISKSQILTFFGSKTSKGKIRKPRKL